MDFLVIIARILFSAIFIMSGLGHFLKSNAMTQYAESKRVPAAKFMVFLTGIMILLGGLSILLGIYYKFGVLLLIIFLLLAAFKIHNFWTITDPMARATEQAHFMKNLALVGASYLIWYFGTGPFSLM